MPTPSKFNFGKAMTELEAIIDSLESGEANLDAALPKFERGMELASQLKQHLASVQNQVEIIKQRFSDTTKEAESGTK